MSGRSKEETPFDQAFKRMIAAHFHTPPDKAFLKLKRDEYQDSLGSFPIDVLNEAISEAKELSSWMPDIATLKDLCKKIVEKRKGILSAAEKQAELEAEGERCKEEFIDAWLKLSRFNKWEVEQIQHEADAILEKQGFPRDFLFGRRGEPGILIRQKMIEIAKERGVI